eukprot:3337983-Prymnesium_polylepis.2
MSLPLDTDISKVKVSTGNANADAIIEYANSLPSAAEMAAHFYRIPCIACSKPSPMTNQISVPPAP